MKTFDYVRFGLKNIMRQKTRTVLTIFAVMIGATSVVAMLTLVFSAKKIVVGQVESAGALTQVTVSANTDITSDDVFNSNSGPGDSAIKLTDATVAQVAAIPHVTSASPTLSGGNLRQAVLKSDPSKHINFDQLVGINPGPDTDQAVSAGRNLLPTDTRSVVLGSQYVDALGFKNNPAGLIGTVLTFSIKGYTGEGADVPKPVMTNSREEQQAYQDKMMNAETTFDITVVGTFASSLFDGSAYLPMSFVRQTMLSRHWEQEDMSQTPQGCKPNSPCNPPTPTFKLVTDDMFDRQGYSVIVAKVDSTENVSGVATQVKALKLGAATAQEMIAQLEKIFTLLGFALGAVGAISLAVASIGVINTMVMATLERTREIGVLRACGATRSTVRRLFTFEAALLGFWGGVAGVAVGYGIVFVAKYFGGSALSAQGVDPSQVSIPIWLALVTVAVTMLIGMLAGFFPAVRAARLNPVEALRYE